MDTNLLLLFCIGSWRRELVRSHKRLAAYTEEDFDLLAQIVAAFSIRYTTPHILAEVCNLAPFGAKATRSEVFSALHFNLINLKEEFVQYAELSQRPEFRWAGLTDTAILAISGLNPLLLTDDLRLADYAARSGIDAFNFNHIRSLNWN